MNNYKNNYWKLSWGNTVTENHSFNLQNLRENSNSVSSMWGVSYLSFLLPQLYTRCCTLGMCRQEYGVFFTSQFLVWYYYFNLRRMDFWHSHSSTPPAACRRSYTEAGTGMKMVPPMSHTVLICSTEALPPRQSRSRLRGLQSAHPPACL